MNIRTLESQVGNIESCAGLYVVSICRKAGGLPIAVVLHLDLKEFC